MLYQFSDVDLDQLAKSDRRRLAICWQWHGKATWYQHDGARLQAVSDKIGLSRGAAFRSLQRCKIPSVVSTVRRR
jgi:hypothetical protein